MADTFLSLDLEGLNLEWQHGVYGDEALNMYPLDMEIYRDTGGLFPLSPGRHIKSLERISSADDFRQDLLRQLLAAKEVLERKNKDPTAGVTVAQELYQDVEREKQKIELSVLKKQVLICQRKNSTSIKMATLERAKKQHGRSDPNELMELKLRLTALNLELEETNKEVGKQKQNLDERQLSHLSVIRDLGGVDTKAGNPLDFESFEKYPSSFSAFNNLLSQTTSILERKRKILALLSGRNFKREKKSGSFHGLKQFATKRRTSDDARSKSTRRPAISGPILNNFYLDEKITLPAPSRTKPHQQQKQNLSCQTLTDPDIEYEANELLDTSKNKKMEISNQALEEIEAFKQLILRFNQKHH